LLQTPKQKKNNEWFITGISDPRMLYRTSSMGPYYVHSTLTERVRVRNVLWFFGLVVIAIGTTAVLYSPETGFGLNEAAKSALIAGLAVGVPSLLWGFAFSRGHSWALVAGIITAGLCLLVFGWRAFKAWEAFLHGKPEKWYPAVLISIDESAALLTFVLLVRIFFQGNSRKKHM